ncbi:unnamed protein product [Haemonchus placei]|uniref:EamA domain-containing protein n=1 Tax=Haemonchus placei TaxID=6290 RepID=A0A0N4WTD4_HAEPC|nr:unnamed protein product [Haemonchus placei]
MPEFRAVETLAGLNTFLPFIGVSYLAFYSVGRSEPITFPMAIVCLRPFSTLYLSPRPFAPSRTLFSLALSL